ncbi:MAG: hypothetical protein SFY67_05205 [Candidatus Melainabacteria bacterium]|nr:hypothetical protein [Candidatus Melainabacteria bacterium]
MPLVNEPTTNTRYYFISCDKRGNELEDHDGINNLLSKRIQSDLILDNSITDIFVLCHGWLVDQFEAKQVFNEWIKAFYELHQYKIKSLNLKREFKPMIIAIHWPSRPMAQSLSTDIANLKDQLADLINEIPDRLRRKGRSALELAHDLLAATTANKRKNHKPEDIISNVFYLTSFFRVKAQAEETGRLFVSSLLALLESNTKHKIHLVGHSFGVLVIATALLELAQRKSKITFSTFYCVQGAISLWSFCKELPAKNFQSGKYKNLLELHSIRYLITTVSKRDKALDWAYPIVMKVFDQDRIRVSSVYPAYGALGAYGVRGYEILGIDIKMLPIDGDYQLQKDIVYNLASEAFIKGDTSTGAGAHNDISKQEVANALWQAVFCDDKRDNCAQI